ncbi:MAG: hypothetical protein C0417_12220 [Chlorobiaceae bacterium]|nr:hypothetical protein [Chlorobiaceae bacterium]
MKRFFFFLFVLILVQSLATFTLCAQQKPGVASPMSDIAMPSTNTMEINKQSVPSELNSILSVSSVSIAGGDRLVATQYTDGSWGWPLTAPPTYPNIIGPIAMGLAQAYQQTGLSNHRTGLANAGTYLLSKTNNFSPSDGYLAAQLDKIFGVTTYISHVKTNFYDKLATGTYDRLGLGTLYTTASYVSKIRTDRANQGIPNMAAWDIGMGLVGAAMCNVGTSEWIAGVKAEIDELNGAAWYDVIGLAGAVYGLAYVNEDFDPTAGEHAAASNINDLAAILAGYQIEGGGFTWNSNYVIPNDGNETIQETGYSILALNEVNRATYLTNIAGAADYMMGVQLGTGGWENYTGSGENNEVTAEALWGISAAYPAPVYNVTKDVYYPTIQAAVNDASAGNLIELAATTHPSGGVTITIDKSLTIIGVGEASTFIDVSTNGAAWGIHVKSSNVTMKKFTIIPATAATNGGYPIHVAPEPPVPGSELSNLILQNISVNGSKRTGIDVHGVNNANISFINSTNATGGNGLQLTGVVGANLSNITTSGNAWGGVAVYNSGPTLLNRGSSNITIDGITSSISELNKFYTQADYGLLITNITATGFNYKVRNSSTVALSAYIWYQITQLNALALAVALPSPSYSTIQSIADNSWFVGPGLTIGAAINAVLTGDLINIASGIYIEGNPQIVINKNITIVGENKASTIIIPAQNTGNSGDSRGWFLINSGYNFNLSNVTLDGSGKLINIGILSRGTGTINNNIFKNIGYNPSGPDYAGRGIAFYNVNMSITNNTLINIGRIGIYMYGSSVTNGIISGNNFTGKGDGNWLDYGIEIEGGAHATITGNTITNCTGVASVDGSTSAGMLITTYFTLGAQATLTDNTFNNNYVGVAVGYLPDDQSTVVAHNNNFSGNTGYGIFSTNPFVNATYNYWGTLHGPQDNTGTLEVPRHPKPTVADMKNAVPAPNLGNAVSENVDYFPWIGPASQNAQGGGIWAAGFVNPTSNPIFAGFDPAALDGVDGRDTVAPPPPPSDYLYLYFLLAPGQPLENYSHDVKKEEASLATVAKHWDLKALTDHTSELVTIEFPIVGLPSGFKPTLYELATGKYRNLRDDPFYEYTSPATETPSSFLILIGDSTKPTVTVATPNGGEFLVVGQPYNITWTSSDGTGVLRHYIYYSLTGAAPYTFIDSTNGNVYSYNWTPDAASSGASIKVIARDSVMNEESDISNHTFQILATNSIAYNAVAGWNLVSPAMQQTDMTPVGIFGDDYSVPYYTFQYNPLSGYSVPSTLNMGQGYWLGSNSSATIDAVGTPLITVNRLLSNGFNIIGNPFAVTMLKDSLKFTNGVITKTMVEAAVAGWLSNVLYGYNGSGYIVENSTLGIWKGYWIPMLSDGITIQYTPSVTTPTPKISTVIAEATPTNWNIDLEAKLTIQNDSYLDNIASFGVHEEATDGFDPIYDAPRPPRSPSNEFIEISFQINAQNYPMLVGANYARDYKKSDNPIWEFVVANSKEGTINLHWDNEAISKLTSDVKIELYDVSANRVIDMKKVNYYSYEQIGTNRKFTINKIDRVIPTAFELIQNYPNPFNPTTTIRYALPFNANVSVQVYDFVGRKVATLVEARQEAGYHEVKFDASQISSGLYFYHMIAIGENGKQFNDSKKMMLLK